MEGKIKCETCKQWRISSAFYTRSWEGRADGIRQPCKVCTIIREKARKMKKPAVWPPAELNWLTPLVYHKECSILEQQGKRIVYAETVTFDPHHILAGDD